MLYKKITLVNLRTNKRSTSKIARISVILDVKEFLDIRATFHFLPLRLQRSWFSYHYHNK